jgi:HK97 gp10 family phage protein
MGITIDGLDELKSRIDAYVSNMGSVIAADVEQECGAAVDRMQSTCPVRTGYLRDHIVLARADEHGAEIDSEAPYSGFVEFGTRRMAAQPFFEPSIVELEATFPDKLSADLSDI